MILSFRTCFIVFLITMFTPSMGQQTVHYDERSGLSSNVIGNVIQDGKGYMWFSTWNGLNRFDGYEFIWMKLQPGDGATISTDRIRDIRLAPDGNIFCHTDEGIFLFDVKTYRFRSLSVEEQRQAAPLMGRTFHQFTDNQGNVWKKDSRPGITKNVTPHHPARVIDGTAGLHVRALMIDSRERLWVATKEDQMLRIYSYKGKGSFLLEGYLGADGNVSTTPKSIGCTVYSLFLNTNGDVWIGCKPGRLMRWSEGKGLTHVSDDIIYDIKNDKQGRLWLSTYTGGIKCCKNPNATQPVISASFGGKRVKKMLITPEGHAIAATSEGLLTADINSGDVEKIHFSQVRRNGDIATSLANDVTIDIIMDRSGDIYVATESSGVDRFRMPLNDATVFTHLSSSTSQLPTDFCLALTMASDSSIIVIGQSNAMLYFMKEGPHGKHFNSNYINYNQHFWADTCRFSECRPIRFNDGTWVFAAEQGGFAVSEHSMMSRGFMPHIVFSQVKVNGNAAQTHYVLSDSIILAADERNFNVSFATIDFSSNEDILYRTSLDGSSWTNASRLRTLSLFDLAPGSHTLLVQSTDCYGRWIDNTACLTIIITPYWYETWWASTLLWGHIVGIVICATYIWLHIRELHRQRRELLQKLINAVPTLVVGEEVAETQVQDEQNKNIPTEVYESPFLLKIRDFIEANISNSDVTIDDMAEAVAASRSTLNRKLRSMIGVTAAQLLIDARMKRATQLLAESQKKSVDITISEIAYKCGYNDPHYFSRCFKQKYGVAPSDYNP